MRLTLAILKIGELTKDIKTCDQELVDLSQQKATAEHERRNLEEAIIKAARSAKDTDADDYIPDV
jgi:chromosome segregation ATPase